MPNYTEAEVEAETEREGYRLFKARRTVLIDARKKGFTRHIAARRQAPAAKFNWNPKKSRSEYSSDPNSRTQSP